MGPLTVHLLYDAPRGAYHHYCAQLCNALVARADIAAVELIAVFGERHRDDVDAEELELLDPRVGLTVLGPGGGTRSSRYRRFVRGLWCHLAAVRRDPPAVLHVHTATGMTVLDFLLVLLYRFYGVRIVRTIHEFTAAERSTATTAWQDWLGRCYLRLARAVISHDVRTHARISLMLPAQQHLLAIIPHGNYLQFRRYIPAGITLAPRPHTDMVLLFLGIKRHKGIDVFIAAMRELASRGSAVRARVVGQINPGDEDRIEQLAGLTNVELDASYQPNTRLWKLYAEADVVLLPYLKGTTSGGIHLAYAFGRPVITSDLECFVDVVQHARTGLITPRGEVAALVAAIEQMAADRSAREAMGRAALAVAAAPAYDWSTIAGLTVAVYRGDESQAN